MRLLILPVLTAAILIGGEMVALPQVSVRVVVPEVVFPVPVVVAPRVVYPQVVVPYPYPYPVYGDYDERRRDVYAYGHRGHESRERAHHDYHRGERERH